MSDCLEAWGLTGTPAEDAVADDLLLIATELLSNAVKFSSGKVSLLLSWGSALRVAVTDSQPEPAAPRMSGPESSGGRGLAIVAALSARWGQTPFANGSKVVWAEVPLASRAGGGGARGTATVTTAEG